jgi:hypothetical protein
LKVEAVVASEYDGEAVEEEVEQTEDEGGPKVEEERLEGSENRRGESSARKQRSERRQQRSDDEKRCSDEWETSNSLRKIVELKHGLLTIGSDAKILKGVVTLILRVSVKLFWALSLAA